MRYLIILLSFLLTACSTGSFSYHQPPAATAERIAYLRAGPAPLNPVVVHTALNTAQQVNLAFLKQGYRSFGASVYHSDYLNLDKATIAAEQASREQGQKVSADLVVMFPVKSINIVNTGRCCSQSGDIFQALYFIKIRVPLGVIQRELNDADRKLINSNHGVTTVATIINSPAFNADIIPGDIITAIDNVPVSGSESFGHYIDTHRNTRVTITLVRKGETLNKSVQLGN